MYVYLIGAGPGDLGLLTIKGMKALSRADVVVYDYLAGEDLMSLARPDAEVIYVGKMAGNHALPQQEINKLLVTKAKEGKIVARLKGGDPYIFGRGGEEGEELAAAGVPFEEIPGISSTIAGPAYAGIPVTHRAFSSSLTIITGHEDPTKPDSVHNWDALAKSASTLVFVMGMKNLPSISANLINAGLDPETPAALIHWGTTDHQRSMTSTIKKLPEEAKEQGFTNPSVIVVGHVVSMRDKLNWFESKPLFGKTVVVTRARQQASDSVALFKDMGARVLEFPTISIKPLDDYSALDERIARLASSASSASSEGYDWVIFTSVNAVRFFRQSLERQNLDARAFGKAKVAAVGPATAEAVREMGIRPDFVPETYVGEGIAEGMTRIGVAGKKILFPRAAQAREMLPTELEKAGAIMDTISVYETVPAIEISTDKRDRILEEINAGKVHCLTFGSSSTVRNFMSAIAPETMKAHPEIKMACIGPQTADTLESFGFKADIMPKDFTIPALVKAVADALSSRDSSNKEGNK